MIKKFASSEGLDVMAISLDGATAGTFENIRRGAKFGQVVEGGRELVTARKELRTECI